MRRQRPSPWDHTITHFFCYDFKGVCTCKASCNLIVVFAGPRCCFGFFHPKPHVLRVLLSFSLLPPVLFRRPLPLGVLTDFAVTASGGGRQYWAAGTGYGHSGAAGEKWDVEAYLAAQREQDRLKEDLLQVGGHNDTLSTLVDFSALPRGWWLARKDVVGCSGHVTFGVADARRYVGGDRCRRWQTRSKSRPPGRSSTGGQTLLL